MIDRKKVIKAVECRKNVYKRCGNPCERIGDCEYAVWARDSDSEPYYPCCCDTEKLCDDILELLKEMEAHIEQLDHDLYVAQNNIYYYLEMINRKAVSGNERNRESY